MSDRATCWSITINNPTEDDADCIAKARQKNWRVDGQTEIGEETGTKHWQLICRTPQVRFSAVKKAFPRAHIEIARNAAALEKYVHKEETRDGALPTQNDKFPSLEKTWRLFADWIEDNRYWTYDEWSGDQWLERFDEFIGDAILRGYHVEGIAVNPSTRQCVKKFGRQIYIRAIAEINVLVSQTDRQTDDALKIDLEESTEET